MSDTVLVILILGIIFLIILYMFRKSISTAEYATITMDKSGFRLELAREARNASLKSLSSAETQSEKASPPATRAKAEEQINNLTTKFKKKVLWVDDQPSNNRYEVQTLKPLGIDIIQVTTNQEAYEALQRSDFSLVLTDIGRGDQNTNGLDLVSSLREQGYSLPIIIYTSERARAHFNVEAARRGATGIAAYPSELVSMVLERLNL